MLGLLTAGFLFAAPVPALPATDLLGQPVDLRAAAGSKATVVVFLQFDCPVSAGYSTTLADLHRSYAGRGVAVVGVVPGDEPLDVLRKQAAGFELPFPLFADPLCRTADALKATTVPEAVVLDANKTVRYRGRVDDGYAARLKKRPVTRHDLRAALDAVLADKPVEVAETPAVGCPITRPTSPAASTGPTFHKEVARVLQTHCQDCHRPGQAGPFSLLTYKQAARWADSLVEYTQNGQMPPWKPTAGPPGGFRNQRSLTELDRKVLADWAAAGCPEGDPADAPPAKTYADEWQNGPPDLILSPSNDFHVAATGADLFRCFVIPTGLAEDKFIVGYEVKPGNPAVVHHTLNFWDLSGKARELEKASKPVGGDRGPGYSVGMGLGFIPVPDPKRPGVPMTGSFGGWAPGQLATTLPEGTGFLLPKGADVVLQTHYHRTGKPETDRLRVGLYFSKGPVKKPFQTVTVGGMGLLSSIPAGKADYVATGSVWLTADAVVHNLIPHMHLIGRSVKMTLTPPDGQAVTLIDIPDWDYNWQETYWLRQPLVAKAGTRIDIRAVYDNSATNPHNPSRPPRRVFFGEDTTNEMLFGFVGVTPVNPGRVRVTRTDPATAPPAKKDAR